jgi:hypothetical protein
LREVLPPFLEQLQASGWMDRWFFVRYADPEAHVRLRFHGKPEVLLGQLLPALQALLAPQVACGAVLGWQSILTGAKPGATAVPNASSWPKPSSKACLWATNPLQIPW